MHAESCGALFLGNPLLHYFFLISKMKLTNRIEPVYHLEHIIALFIGQNICMGFSHIVQNYRPIAVSSG
jgi:hypothetical protein